MNGAYRLPTAPVLDAVDTADTAGTADLTKVPADVADTAAVGDSCPVRVLHPEAMARAQATLRPDEDYANLAETFRALGDASRAKILHALLSGELCVCDLAALIGISDSAISQHLRVLRSLRIVRNRKVGRVVYYSLEDACIRALLAVALTHLDDPDSALPPVSLGSRVPAPRLACQTDTQTDTDPAGGKDDGNGKPA
ncbi:MAG: ArsR/SmtB family transcription factor [Chloroflexota bacterium]